MRIFCLTVMFCAGSLFATVNFAATVAGLYQAKVPVGSQNASQRAEAVALALQQVFIKVSGNSNVIKISGIRRSLRRASAYLQAYSYVDGKLANDSTALFLQAQFNPQSVNHLLLKNNETLWGENRPLVLVWLAYAPANTDNLLSAGGDANSGMVSDAGVEGHISALGDTSMESNAADNGVTANFTPGKTEKSAQWLLARDARHRGLPVIFPILDLMDLQTISATNVWNGNVPVIKSASVRYHSDMVLAGRIAQNARGQWRAHWILTSSGAEGMQTSWDDHAAALPQLIAGSVNKLTDILAARYGVSVDQSVEGHVQLTVVNINNLADYASVNRYLQSLTSVRQVNIIEIKSNAMVFDVQAVGGKAALERALSLNHRLMVVPAMATNNAVDNRLTYQWIL